MKLYKNLIIIIIILILYKNEEFECNCIIKICDKLEYKDALCDDKFGSSCNKYDINKNILKDDIKNKCDCCWKNKCYTNGYLACLLYNLYEYISLIFFFFFTINLYILFQLFLHFFNIKNKNKKIALENKNTGLNAQNLIIYKYSGLLWIKKNKNRILNKSSEKDILVNDFLNKIDNLKIIGIKNIIEFLVLVIIYLFIYIIHFYLIYIVPDNPFFYSKIFWVPILLLMIFFLYLFIIYKKSKIYKKEMYKIINDFQNNNNCLIRINKLKRTIQFNFNNNKWLLQKI